MVKRHPLAFGIIGFLILTLPQTVSSYLDLWERATEASVHINWYSWILPILPLVGLALFGVVIWQIRRQVNNKEVKQEISEQSLTIPHWLKQLASQDLDNLSQRIKVEIRELQFAGLTDNAPYFELIISITNTTVFKIKLTGCVGFIQAGGRLVTPQVNEPLPLSIAHSERKKITLNQAIPEKIAQLYREQAELRNPLNFVCSQCRLAFELAAEGYKGSVEIPLREGGLPCIPKGIVVVSDATIGTVTS